MVRNSLNIDELYSYYIKTIEPVISNHFDKRKRERLFLLLISVGIFICGILMNVAWGTPHFIFLSIFLIIFVFTRHVRHVDLGYKERLASLILKYIDEDSSYKDNGYSSVVNIKNSGLYPQVNFEECSAKITAVISNIPVSLSFVKAKKIRKIAISNFALGSIVCIFFIFVWIIFFEKVFPKSLINVYFGGGLGIFFTYWFLSEFNNIRITGETIFGGLLIAANFNKKFYGKTLVFSTPTTKNTDETIRLLKLSGLVSVNFDDGFNDDFAALTVVLKEAHSLLTPKVRKAFRLAKENLGGQVDFSFTRSSLFMTVRTDNFLNESIFKDSDPFHDIAAFCGKVNLIFNTISVMDIENVA